MALRGLCKNRGAVATSRRCDVENQHRDIAESAETEHLDIATLPNDVATFGIGFGSILST